MRRFGFFLFALLAYAVALGLTLPAERVYAWLGPVDGVQVGGLSGTLWRGEAQLVAGGQRIERLQWRFRPAALLGGRVAFALEAEHAAGQVATVAALGPGGELVLQDVSLDLDAHTPALADLTGFDWHGRISGGFSRITFDGERIGSAEGRLMWQQAGVELAEVVELGDLVADVGDRDGRLTIRLSDAGGPLAVEGELVRGQPGQLSADVEITPRAEAPPVLRDSLSLMGRTERDGSVRLQGPVSVPLL